MKWYQANPERFEIEKRLLAKYHPGAKVVIKDGKVRVIKRFRTRKATYTIEGIFAADHPYSEMRFYVRKPRIRKSPLHRYDKGRLCLNDPNDVGPETTAKVYLDWAVDWLLTYERWLDGETWPPTNQG